MGVAGGWRPVAASNSCLSLINRLRNQVASVSIFVLGVWADITVTCNKCPGTLTLQVLGKEPAAPHAGRLGPQLPHRLR